MPCLDTNFLIELIRGNPDAEKKIRGLEARKTPVKTTAINECELYKGAYKSRRKEENLELIDALLRSVVILNFDLDAANAAGGIMEDLRSRGQTISAMDVLIAATSIIHDETLITKDTEHFKRIKDLRIETW